MKLSAAIASVQGLLLAALLWVVRNFTKVRGGGRGRYRGRGGLKSLKIVTKRNFGAGNACHVGPGQQTGSIC